MNCPKCTGQMETVKVDEYEVDRCGTCGGLWFDLLEHERLKRLAGSERIDTGPPAGAQVPAAPRKVDCPRCHTGMIQMAFPEQPQIHYEMCSVCHGLFLDAGEFKDLKEVTLLERIKYAFGH